MSSKFFAAQRKGFTLIELLVVIAIIAILAAILFPVFAKARAKARQASGASNQKQIGLAFLQYIQDYDEKFPIGYGAVLVAGTPTYTHWGIDWLSGTNTVPGLLQPYVKSKDLFNDPSGPRGKADVDYMYNDFLAGKSQAALAGVAQTVVTCDSSGANPSGAGTIALNANGPTGGTGGVTLGWNFGHSVSQPLQAATSGTNYGNTAPLRDVAKFEDVTRHSDGGNFSFSDGHVKWYKVTWEGTNSTKTVYFPPQATSTGSANTALGQPVPGGNMAGFGGTFQLN